ncbi:hypothetical protein PV328_004243 [Microctonus aethiopoides]|uniref:Uncharacterized protein n=1 Tax=Microctonus aethiopoides TaxID=144406 RepID=A0AA39FA72_9HYME|nr:hypothetical protein PV328_004243 [Microctonus aethiopoides]
MSKPFSVCKGTLNSYVKKNANVEILVNVIMGTPPALPNYLPQDDRHEDSDDEEFQEFYDFPEENDFADYQDVGSDDEFDDDDQENYEHNDYDDPLYEGASLSPNLFKSTLHLFRKSFSRIDTPVVRHFYCSSCFAHLGENENCDACSQVTQANSYFLIAPIIERLKTLYRRPGFINKPQHRNQRRKTNIENFEDIYDGNSKKLASFMVHSAVLRSGLVII